MSGNEVENSFQAKASRWLGKTFPNLSFSEERSTERNQDRELAPKKEMIGDAILTVMSKMHSQLKKGAKEGPVGTLVLDRLSEKEMEVSIDERVIISQDTQSSPGEKMEKSDIVDDASKSIRSESNRMIEKEIVEESKQLLEEEIEDLEEPVESHQPTLEKLDHSEIPLKGSNSLSTDSGETKASASVNISALERMMDSLVSRWDQQQDDRFRQIDIRSAYMSQDIKERQEAFEKSFMSEYERVMHSMFTEVKGLRAEVSKVCNSIKHIPHSSAVTDSIDTSLLLSHEDYQPKHEFDQSSVENEKGMVTIDNDSLEEALMSEPTKLPTSSDQPMSVSQDERKDGWSIVTGRKGVRMRTPAQVAETQSKLIDQNSFSHGAKAFSDEDDDEDDDEGKYFNQAIPDPSSTPKSRTVRMENTSPKVYSKGFGPYPSPPPSPNPSSTSGHEGSDPSQKKKSFFQPASPDDDPSDDSSNNSTEDSSDSDDSVSDDALVKFKIENFYRKEYKIPSAPVTKVKYEVWTEKLFLALKGVGLMKYLTDDPDERRVEPKRASKSASKKKRRHRLKKIRKFRRDQ